MLDLETLLRKPRLANPNHYLGDTKIEQICGTIGSSQKQLSEYVGTMSDRVELLKGLEDVKTVSKLVTCLDEQVSALEISLENVGDTANKIATSGRQNATIKRIYSKISETESNLKTIRTAATLQC